MTRHIPDQSPGLFVLALAGLLVTASPAHADAAGTVEGTLDGLGKGPFVVYVNKVPGTPVPTDPAPVMNQNHNTYVPHVLPIVAGSKVEFRSSDPELHNVYAWALALKRVLFNVAIPPTAPSYRRVFADEGVVRLTCNVHKEMLAYIVVLQNPHFALVEKGATRFRLDGVPAGKHELRVWGEKLEDATLTKRFRVEVPPGGVASASITP